MGIRWKPIVLALVSGLILAGLLLFPVSSLATRIATIGAGGSVVLSLLWLSRDAPLVFLPFYLLSALLITVAARAPSRTGGAESLRSSYVGELVAYENTPYFWGGESRSGIDCSGLIRRALIDAMVKRALFYGDLALLRSAADLWWNDASAFTIGEGYGGRTLKVAQCDSLNSLDHSLLFPGDVAVTDDGAHTMAYLGDGKWVGADPSEGRVVLFSVPERDSAWFKCPMNIVRWVFLVPFSGSS